MIGTSEEDYYKGNMELLGDRIRNKKGSRTNLSISLDNELKRRFIEYCESEGYFLSHKVEDLMKKHLDGVGKRER